MTFTVIDELAVGPGARVYAEGWQSWSPTAWWPAGADADRPEHAWQYLMRFRPDKPLPRAGCQAEGLLVVEPDGTDAVCFALTNASETVTSLRARSLSSGVLEVSADGPVRRTTHPDGAAALATTSAALGAPMRASGTPIPRVWCSWYHYFETVTAADIAENIAAIDRLGLPVDLIQIDDGWARGPGLGEYAAPTPGFGDLAALVDRIRAGGRRAGVWLAPFLAGRDSTLAREHPDWLTTPAGFNWGQELVGLDLTHPGVRGLIAEVVTQLRTLGFTYLKLDFLYAGALPGARREQVSPLEAYRSGLSLIGEVAGPDVLLLGCGAPMLPSLGLVDAMRVSPDTFHAGGEDGSRGLRGARSVAARSWQDGRLWANDPDCLVARPGFALRDAWAAAIRDRGALRSFSDRVADLDAHGVDLVRAHLSEPGRA